MSFRSRSMRWMLLLLVATVGLACSGDEGGNEQQAAAGRGGGSGGMAAMMGGAMGGGAAIPVAVRPADRGDIAASLLTYTSIEAERHVDVISRAQGLVKTIYVEEGDRVQEGQSLAQLDDAALKLQLREREVNLQSLKAVLDRAEGLRDKELISREEFEQTRFNYETAQTQYESAKLNLEYATIRSPFSGIITGRLIEVGNLVNANQVVFRAADFNPLLARIFVPEREIRQVKLGQTVRISVEGASERFLGRVRMISPVVDPASGTIKVTVEISDKTQTLRPGMFATVHIITEVHDNALRIEKKALVSEAEGTFAFLFKGGLAQKARLELGFSEGDWVEVLSGFSDGDSIITVGHEGLRNGAPVRIAGQPVTQLAAAAGQTGGQERPDAGMRSGQGDLRPSDGQRGQAGQGGFRPGGGQGGGMMAMDIDQMKERLFRNPQIKEAYDKKAKEDPDFEKNEEKQRQFFREMIAQMRGGGGRPQGQ